MSLLRRLGMLNRAGMRAFNEGRYNDAMFQLMQAKSIARQMESPLHEAKVRNNIGLVHQGAGNIDDALESFRLAAVFAVEGAGEGNILHKAIDRNMAKIEMPTCETA